MTDSSVMIDIPLEPLGVPFGKFDGGDITGTIGSIGDGIENGEKGSNNGKEDEGVDAPDGGGDSDTLSNVTSPPIRSYEVSFPGDLFPRIAKPYVLGDKSEVTISSGNIFIGRKMGGKTRDQIYGTRYVIISTSLLTYLKHIGNTEADTSRQKPQAIVVLPVVIFPFGFGRYHGVVLQAITSRLTCTLLRLVLS